MPVLRSTSELGLRPDATGKVRDLFDLGDRLLIVATDRISAYDVVMNEVVPGRGVVLTVMTIGWLERFPDVPNHLITADPRRYPAPFCDHDAALRGRSMLVHKARRLDVECVVRGWLAGSGWRSYRQDNEVCGIALPSGLQLGQQLPEPIFTPATKAATGHDENISLARMAELLGRDRAETLRALSLCLYREAAAYAEPRGVIIADTKFEFGLIADRLTLIDEVLTPDSSRFWPASGHRPGQEPPSWDKQILRNHLDAVGWNHDPPPPALPPDILARTAARYRDVLDILLPQQSQLWQESLS